MKMQCINRLPVWTIVLTSALLYMSPEAGVQAGTDDFRFINLPATRTEIRLLMSEDEIVEIFNARLDLFPRSQAPKLARHLIDLCEKYRFDPALILSVIQVESAFRISVVSSAGAVGLMQLMPATAAYIAKLNGISYPSARALRDPYTNLSLGVAYLSYLRTKYRGMDPYFQFAAYNMGPARLDVLRARKEFKPRETKKYYDLIRRGVPEIRFFRDSLVSKL